MFINLETSNRANKSLAGWFNVFLLLSEGPLTIKSAWVNIGNLKSEKNIKTPPLNEQI